jgi:hypothetical protein
MGSEKRSVRPPPKGDGSRLPKSEAPRQIEGRVHLHLGANFEDAWTAVIEPWFRKSAPVAAFAPAPCAVVVPSQSYAVHLKSRLTEAGLGIAGIHFWTPHEVRSQLISDARLPITLLSRELLHLYLCIAAGEIQLASPPETGLWKIARAIAASPGGLVEAVDAIVTSGRSTSDAIPVGIGAICERYLALARQHPQFRLVQDFDRSIPDCLPPGAMHHLLLVGFDSFHWESWSLLSALPSLAATTEVVLFQPRMSGEKMDQIWVGSWEEAFSPAEPIPESADSPRSPFVSLSDTVEIKPRGPGGLSADEATCRLLMGRDGSGEAAMAVAEAIRFLADPNCSRIGILVPSGSSPLAREIQVRLAREGFSHFDSLGHRSLPSSIDCWHNWLAFEETPSMSNIVRLMRTCQNTHAPLVRGDPGFNRLLDAITEAYEEILMGDVDLLEAHLRLSNREEWQKAGSLLEPLKSFPEESVFSEFLRRTKAKLDHLGLDSFHEYLQQRLPPADLLDKLRLRRADFLRWLSAAGAENSRERSEKGRHPFSRIWILPYPEAEWQSWSHLILTGMNDGVWPPSMSENGFLDEKIIRHFNEEATVQGSQGEGHVALKRGLGLIIGPAELRALHPRQLLNILESARCGVSLTASMTSADAQSRLIPPNELFQRLYRIQHGRVLNEERAAELMKTSESWLDEIFSSERKYEDFPHVTKAYRRRREMDQPFGEFDFSLGELPSSPLLLACKRWEEAVRNPAAVWLEKLLGVKPIEDFEDDPWQLAKGNWVHQWLNHAFQSGREVHSPKAFFPLPNQVELLTNMRKAALAQRGRVVASFESVSRSIPEWWQMGFDEIQWTAGRILSNLPRADTWSHALPEWSLPDNHRISHGDSELLVRGRMDLMLSNRAGFDGRLLVLDFKTGSTGDFAPSDIREGRGLQLLLYWLAAKGLGAAEAACAFITPDVGDLELYSDDECERLLFVLPALVRMQKTGVFGMRGQLRAARGYRSPLPLATLEIPQEIVDERFTITHPEFLNTQPAS